MRNDKAKYYKALNEKNLTMKASSMRASPSQQKLALLSVARISYGPHPYLIMIDVLKQSTVRALAYRKCEQEQ